jgi:hypothetical protein
MKLGSEFQVNTYTTGMQGSHVRDDIVQIDVSFAPSGEFVVVWTSSYQDGSEGGIFARRYDSTGVPAGTEFQVNSYTTATQEQPAIVHDAAGNFVVVWSSWTQDGDGIGVFGRRFDTQGNATSTEFQVNTATTLNQQLPLIANDAAGDFVVAWTYQENDPPNAGSDYDIHAQRFSSTAAPLGTEFPVNSETQGRQWFGDIGMDSAGNFIVAWDSASYTQILARRFDTAGTPLGTDFPLTSNAFAYVGDPELSMVADGRFLLTWATGSSEDTRGILGTRFDASATPLEPAFLVNDYLADSPFSPARHGRQRKLRGCVELVWPRSRRSGLRRLRPALLRLE